MKNNHLIKATLISIFIAIEMIIFKEIYGLSGVLIGMLMGLAGNSLLLKDFTYHPLKNLLKFTLINISIGLFPYLSQLNIYYGILINFTVVFIVTYLLIYNLKAHLYHPFILTYVYMLGTRITIHELPLRIGVLILGAFFIMILQLIFNNDFSNKLGHKYLNLILQSLLIQNKAYITGTDDNKEFIRFKFLCEEWSNLLYERKDSYFYLDNSENSDISLIINLEKLGDELHKLFLSDLSLDSKTKVFNLIEDFLLSAKNLENTNSSFDELYNKFDALVTTINSLNKKNQSLYRISDFIDILYEKLIESKKLSNHKGYINIEHKNKVSQFNFIAILKNNFNRKSLRFNFAFKVALVVSVIEFIISYANIPHGKWILIATYALLTPFDENNGKLIIERLIGTLIGAIVFIFIIALIPKGIDSITLIVIISVYLTNLTKKNYVVKILLDCLLSLSFASISMQSSQILAFNKLECTIIAIITAFLCNFSILPYKTSDNIKNIINMYYKMSENLLKDLLEKKNLDEFRFSLKNTILKSKVIENKIMISNIHNNKKNIKQFVDEQRYLLENSYILMRRLYKDEHNNKAFKECAEILKDYFENTKTTGISLEEYLNNINYKIPEHMKFKECFGLLCEIIESNKKSYYLKEEIV